MNQNADIKLPRKLSRENIYSVLDGVSEVTFASFEIGKELACEIDIETLVDILQGSINRYC